MVKGDPKLILNPWWVTGITDGEGNFSVFVTQGVNKPKVNLTFKVDQKEDSAGILYDLLRFFKCGNVVLDSRGYKTYKVSNIADIFKYILPHFDKYSLITSKQLNYLAFKEIAILTKDKEYLNLQGLNNIIAISNSMNSRRSFLEKWTFLEQQKLNQIDPHWLQAFIDGEGSFQFGIATRLSRGRPYVATTPSLEIAQNTHDIKVLNWIKNFFGAGYLKPKFDVSNFQEVVSVRGVSRYILRDSSFIINFIDKYPMLTRKQEDYLKWKELVFLKDKRAFDTEDGRAMMESIKLSMNRGKYK
uniref:Homing endonuclease LAGLIDADG domain-containing protein n=1 Tax=Cantharellus lutescens TaxID=104198 RepID=A0A2S0S4D8_9AGAM|nr:hypothetical protein [Cantharellus lutescens]AWA82215.1 hypothetical protein [Cantharellus lutescens]